MIADSGMHHVISMARWATCLERAAWKEGAALPAMTTCRSDCVALAAQSHPLECAGSGALAF